MRYPQLVMAGDIFCVKSDIMKSNMTIVYFQKGRIADVNWWN